MNYLAIEFNFMIHFVDIETIIFSQIMLHKGGISFLFFIFFVFAEKYFKSE